MAYTYSARRLVDDLHIHLFVAETVRMGLEWNSADVQSAYWRFYRNDRDGAWLDLDGRRVPLEAGRLYFVPAGVRFTCGNSVKLDHFYVHFDLVGFQPVALQEWLQEPILLPRCAELEAAAVDLSGRLRGRGPVDLADQCRVKSLIYSAFALYFGGLGTDALERSAARAAELAPILPALRLIEATLGGEIDNARLAAESCMSEDHFIRRFRCAVGKTPGRYLVQRRVTVAAQQLRFTSGSIDSIAEATGFGNRFYFSRVFTREMGVTPARYRRGETGPAPV